MKPKSHRKQENPAPTINNITMKGDKQKNKQNHRCLNIRKFYTCLNPIFM